MKIQYFPDTDTLAILLCNAKAIELTSKPIISTEAITDDLILDYDAAGKIVAITLDNYSKNVDIINLQTLDLPVLQYT